MNNSASRLHIVRDSDQVLEAQDSPSERIQSLVREFEALAQNDFSLHVGTRAIGTTDVSVTLGEICQSDAKQFLITFGRNGRKPKITIQAEWHNGSGFCIQQIYYTSGGVFIDYQHSTSSRAMYRDDPPYVLYDKNAIHAEHHTRVDELSVQRSLTTLKQYMNGRALPFIDRARINDTVGLR